MLQAGIETQLTVHQSDILPQSHRHLGISKELLRHIFIYAYRLLECSTHRSIYKYKLAKLIHQRKVFIRAKLSKGTDLENKVISS